MSTLKLPELNEGEFNAGIIMEDGKLHHWLILLPGDHEAADWKDSKAWAASINGELPTRREQSLLFANCKQHFERDWYWSGEAYASAASSAWMQGFGYGGQGTYRTSGQCRARAVRRLPI